MLILFARHPQTAWNTGGAGVPRVRAWKDDVDLAPEAQAEREHAAQRLVGLDMRKIYRSDLVRARAMAQGIVNATNVPALVTPKLRPWNLGEWEGQPVRDVAKLMLQYMLRRPTDPVPGGEAWQDAVDRYLTFLKFVWALPAAPGELAVIVAHGRNGIITHAWQEAGAPMDVNVVAPWALENETTIVEPGKLALMGPGVPITQLDDTQDIIAQIDPLKVSVRGHAPPPIGQVFRDTGTGRL